jgi:hypothetical protein
MDGTGYGARVAYPVFAKIARFLILTKGLNQDFLDFFKCNKTCSKDFSPLEGSLFEVPFQLPRIPSHTAQGVIDSLAYLEETMGYSPIVFA